MEKLHIFATDIYKQCFKPQLSLATLVFRHPGPSVNYLSDLSDLTGLTQPFKILSCNQLETFRDHLVKIDCQELHCTTMQAFIYSCLCNYTKARL